MQRGDGGIRTHRVKDRATKDDAYPRINSAASQRSKAG